MGEMGARELHEVIEAHTPYDGPHDQETVTQAAYAVERLIRYLNNATRSYQTLEFASTSYQVVNEVHGAVYGLRQLLDQISKALAHQDHKNELYDDRRDHMPAATVFSAQSDLGLARQSATQLARYLELAASHLGHLGNKD